MRPQSFDVDLDTQNTDGSTLVAGLTGAGPWTNADWDVGAATGAMSDGLAHKLNLYSAANLSGITLTLTGTDADGQAQTETIAGPNAGTSVTTKYFKTLTALSADSTLGANTMNLDLSDEAATQTFPIDWRSPYQANILVDVTGTINFTVQEMWQNVYGLAAPQQNGTWLNISALASKTADTASQATNGATAVRLIVNSYSAGAELQMYITQTTGR